ncbi:hypothetical protein TrRE_jg1192 [Triparma retinervis]|uniref:glucosylceramidase n=1 Tax=Triparma retinervis TaxID=2557542 RepID=A0A9W6ZN43_9STRA|nr:hypothetical protein TrRE_jg1192 [Triparma retinervis]
MKLLSLLLPTAALAFTDYSEKCTSESPCSTIESISNDDFPTKDTFVIYTTSQSGDRLQKANKKMDSSSNGGWQEIRVDLDTNYQTIVGFGGALTDAAAININTLDKGLQQQVIDSYYTEGGLEYSLGRVPIASCDFSTEVYSYVEVEEDLELESFDISVDSSPTTGDKMGLIQRVLKATANPISLFASPWAPPAWMTQTNSTVGNPSLREEVEIYQSWSKYFTRFFEAYRAAGVEFWGVTVQNEPAGNTGAWQDLKMSPEEQRDFIKNYLGPELRAFNPDLKIMMHDDQRVHLKKWTDTILGDPEAAQYVDGVGIHWYSEVEDYVTWATKPFDKMNDVKSKYPDQFILATEACNGFIPIIDQGPKLGDWNRGERYGYDILHDLNAHAVGWTDWNIALDLTGGPNWAKNVVDAPILIDAESGDAFYRNPMWYYLGHFSKFVRPGSVRVGCSSTAPFTQSPMEAACFETPDDKVVIVVLNRDITGHKYNVQVVGTGNYINVEVEKHSIQTIVFPKP